MNAPPATPILELRDVTKAFGSIVANDHVSLRVLPGRVHALVGENGAGKTTLMTMVAGTASPDSGEIWFDGGRVHIANPQKAGELGIGMVHQHFKLVPSLTVAANVFLGRELRTSRGTLDTAVMESRVAELSRQFGLGIDPRARVASLSVGLRQRVEVLKALSHETRLLILDEPTAVLTPGEAEELFGVIRSLAAQGCAVVFISHKLGEVLEIADDVTVIRDGRVIDTLPAAGLSQGDIAQMMVGREVLLRIEHTPASPGEPVLTVQDLTVVDERGVRVLEDLSLEVRAGEIVGVAGVEGNGQSELAAAIGGMLPVDEGRITLAGRDLTGAGVAARRAAGIAYIPEDRYEVGAGPNLSVAENLISTHLEPPVARAGWVSTREAHAFAGRLIREFDVRGASPSTRMGALSGGNMQKVIIAREFASEPRLLVVSQPTRGVDVGAMEFVHNAIVALRDEGAGVLLLSADLNEVMSLSDRLLVMYRGRILAEFTQDTMTEEAVGLAMAGVRPDEPRSARQDRGTPGTDRGTGRGGASRHAAPAAEPSDDPVLRAHAAVEAVEGHRQSTAARAAAGGTEPSGSSATAPPPESRAQRARRAAARLLAASVQPVVAILIALAIGALIILALGENPVRAYDELFLSSFRTPFGIAAFLAQFVPLAILAAAVIVSFRAGFFNIGGEGQLFLGAIAGAWVGFTFPDVPGPLLMLAVLVAGVLGGMVWGIIPGTLLALWRVDIIVTTLMLSSIAVLLTAYLVSGPLRDPTAGMAASPRIAEAALLPMLVPAYGLGVDLLLALATVVALALVLTRSVWGLHVRQLGEMNRFAEYTGVSPKAMSVEVMALSGAAAGLAGAIFVIGPNGGRFLQNFSPGYGFLGITVALLARLNPWAAIVAAAFYANMMAGSNGMQINTGVPFPLVNVLQGIIILVITAVVVLDRRTRERVLAMLPLRRRGATASISDPQPPVRREELLDEREDRQDDRSPAGVAPPLDGPSTARSAGTRRDSRGDV